MIETIQRVWAASLRALRAFSAFATRFIRAIERVLGPPVRAAAALLWRLMAALVGLTVRLLLWLERLPIPPLAWLLTGYALLVVLAATRPGITEPAALAHSLRVPNAGIGAGLVAWLNVAIGALIVAGVMRVGRNMAPDRPGAGVVAGAIVAFSPALVYWASAQGVLLAGPLVLTAILLWLTRPVRRPLRDLALALLIFLGAITFLQPIPLMLVLGLLVIGLLDFSRSSRLVTAMLLVSLGVALIVGAVALVSDGPGFFAAMFIGPLGAVASLAPTLHVFMLFIALPALLAAVGLVFRGMLLASIRDYAPARRQLARILAVGLTGLLGALTALLWLRAVPASELAADAGFFWQVFRWWPAWAALLGVGAMEALWWASLGADPSLEAGPAHPKTMVAPRTLSRAAAAVTFALFVAGALIILA
jgi:hypothetical protein